MQRLQEYSELSEGFDNLSFRVSTVLCYNYIYKGMFPLSLLRNELNGTLVNRKNGDYCSGGVLEITDGEKFNSLAKETLEDRFFYNIDYTDDKDIDLVLNRKIRREGYFKIIDEDNSIVL